MLHSVFSSIYDSEWWNDLRRANKNTFRQFVEQYVSAALASREARAAIEASTSGRWDSTELTVRANAVTREICATYVHDEGESMIYEA